MPCYTHPVRFATKAAHALRCSSVITSADWLVGKTGGKADGAMCIVSRSTRSGFSGIYSCTTPISEAKQLQGSYSVCTVARGLRCKGTRRFSAIQPEELQEPKRSVHANIGVESLVEAGSEAGTEDLRRAMCSSSMARSQCRAMLCRLRLLALHSRFAYNIALAGF